VPVVIFLFKTKQPGQNGRAVLLGGLSIAR
jgi:hypothetical protein